MSPTQRFDRLWQEAYERELPVLREAARLAREDPGLAATPVALFRVAARLRAAADTFLDHPALAVSGPDPGHVAAMMQLLS